VTGLTGLLETDRQVDVTAARSQMNLEGSLAISWKMRA
jgi:hypothetical protein